MVTWLSVADIVATQRWRMPDLIPLDFFGSIAKLASASVLMLLVVFAIAYGAMPVHMVALRFAQARVAAG